MKLRDYQEAALDHIEGRRLAGDVRVPIVLATGLGKTQIFTSYIDRWLARHPGQRALVIAHTDELIEQAAKRMRQIAPARRTGIVKAERDEVLAEIVVSSRQTLASGKRRERLKKVGLIVIDECHHAVRTNTYGKILEHFGAFDDPSPVFVLGVTATLARSDKSKLSTVWQSGNIFRRDILFGIREGYLLDVRGERITVPALDLSRVRMSGGDYRESDLAEELERTFAPEAIAREYARITRVDDGHVNHTYRKGIAFWPLVETAYHGCRAFEAEGIPSAVVHGGTPRQERRDILRRFHEGSIRVVHNAMVLTEGFDEPSADVVVIARPTRSAPLYQQMVGRVLRPDLTVPSEQREKALILRAAGKEDDDDELTLRTLIDLSPERVKMLDEKDTDDLSLFELDELMQEIEEELDEKRAGATTWFDSPTYAGETKTKTFDPLGRDKVWGQTPAGNYHISAGNAYVFLAESINGDPGTWDVVMCSKNTYKDRYAPWDPWIKGTEHQGLHLDMALSWAEEVAIELGGVGTKTLTSRKSAWRRAEPSDRQKRKAYVLKINFEGMTQGELSEAIDTTEAARRIDPLVAQIKAFYAEQEYKQNKVHKRLCGARTAEECVCDAV